MFYYHTGIEKVFYKRILIQVTELLINGYEIMVSMSLSTYRKPILNVSNSTY